MFSYLKPHRRSPSNPTSPVPDSAHSWEGPLHYYGPEHAQPPGAKSQDASIPAPNPPSPASASPPPSLPPIPRVSSVGYERGGESRYIPESADVELGSRTWRPRLEIQVADTSAPSSTQWTQPFHGQRPDSADDSTLSQLPPSHHPRPHTAVDAEQVSVQRPGGIPLPFVTAADLQVNQPIPGRRPTGVRMPTPPPAPAPVPASTFEPTQPRSGKHTRLNLLNPMSLLARRRTAHAVSELSIPTAPGVPQSTLYDPAFDPRIRGTKIHDFSAPKPRRIVSDNSIPNIESRGLNISQNQRSPSWQYSGQELPISEEGERSPWSGGNHTPVFTEDFEEQQYPAAGPHVRKASDISDLPLPKPPYANQINPTKDRSATKTGGEEPSQDLHKLRRNPTARKPVSASANTDPNVDGEQGPNVSSNTERHISIAPPQISRPKRASKARRASRNVSEPTTKDVASHGLPKHMKSNSSRFSFDMVGAASQERLLEERHRQKALEKQSASPETGFDHDDRGFDEEDDFDYDNFDDDDGLEERIPGINADADDEYESEMEGLAQNPGLSAFTFHSMNVSIGNSPLTPYTPANIATPRDDRGEVIGFAISKESPEVTQHHPDSLTASKPETRDDLEQNVPNANTANYNGLGLIGLGLEDTKDTHVQTRDQSQSKPFRHDGVGHPELDDDELYFDDGIISHPEDDGEGVEFDESIFDNEDTDEYGRPLRPLSSLPTLYSPPLIQPDPQPSIKGKDYSGPSARTSQERSSQDGPLFPTYHSSISDRSMAGSQASNQIPLPPAAHLTHDTLVAYQSALAAAAQEAAATGRFRRDSTPIIQVDENQISPENDKLPGYSFSHEPEDDFDYDDALEDDAIIAAANAEALANDPDGFYGQEFGYYSAPTGAEAEYVNGGYFGPRGADGLGRSHSGRAIPREPNLTPITERSEYSNRNSALSLQFPHNLPGAGSISGANLAQLAGTMSEYDEENMSLSALLKLRRGAWGGSQASLRSSNGGGGSPLSAVAGGDDASPINQLSPWVTQSNSQFLHVRHNSNFSLASEGVSGGRESDGNSSPGSPTLTLANLHVQHPKSQPPSPSPNAQLSVKAPTAISTVPPQPVNAPPPPPTTIVTSLQARNSPTMSPTSATTPGTASSLTSAVGLVSPTNDTFDRDNGFYNLYKNNSGRGRKSSVDGASSAGGRRTMHRHTGSSDSISYMKEEDPVTGQRWVLERRRTGEDGGIKILGREVVSGGRI